jgi:ubiquinone/menaquinone biosynthesis C-methylase UbiE
LRAAAACQFIDEIPTSEELSQRIFAASADSQAMCPGQPLYFLISYLLAGFEIESWNRLDDSLRTGERAMDIVLGMPLWEYLDRHPDESRNFHGAMTALSAPIHLPLVKAYPDFSQMEVVMDVGGGQGGFLTAILQANPTVQGILFDQQQVVDQARQQIAQAGLSERCTYRSGSFLEAIPGGANAYILKNVLHDWDDNQVLHILQNVHRSTRPGTRVLIAEVLMPERKPPFAVCGLDLAMLIETGGRERTAQEFEQLLHRSGFTLERVIPVNRTLYSIVEGKAH